LDNAFDVIVAGGRHRRVERRSLRSAFRPSHARARRQRTRWMLLSIEHIEGFPGFPEGVPGYDLCPMVQEQAEAAGAEFVSAELERIETDGDGWRAHAGGETYAARALVVATGARLRALDVPGEAALHGKGVSHCASCDAPLLRGRAVVVVGSGDSAMQESLHLASHASKVTMLHRGSALGGQASYRERVLADPRIEHRYGVVVSEILGDGAVTGVRVQPTEGGPGSELEASGVFIYVGVEPNAEVVRDSSNARPAALLTAASLRTARRGCLQRASCARASDKLWCGGDGVTAAITADRYLRDGS